MTIETTRLNDVDLETVGGLIAAVREDPGKAHTTWNATVAWDGGFTSKATIREHDPLPSDEPRALGGTDTAPNPVEQLLGAVGNCLAVGYAANATAAGIEINELRIEVEGDVDLHTFLGLRPGHAGFEQIEVEVHLDADVTRETLEELHEKVISTSPVGHTLSHPVNLAVKLA